MKHQKMIKLIAMTGLVLGPLYAAASSFGGGWVQNSNTGTLYYSLAPTPERHQVASDEREPKRHMNGFGGGWVHNSNTGTLYYSLAPTPERQQVASDEREPKRHMNGFGGGWAHNKDTGTLSYQPQGDDNML